MRRNDDGAWIVPAENTLLCLTVESGGVRLWEPSGQSWCMPPNEVEDFVTALQQAAFIAQNRGS